MGPLEGPIILCESLEDGRGPVEWDPDLLDNPVAEAGSKLSLELLHADTLSLTVFRSLELTPEANYNSTDYTNTWHE